MIGERDDIVNETEYGTLTMRSYDIDGNAINAFYDDSDDLIFVLDNTINQNKPNVLLVINPMGDKKWDEILAGEYDVDLETIRPKQDNKYQKLDIEYSGLSVYENLINAYVAGDDLSEHLNQLNILRDSAARHSAMIRLNVANETISKTNITIVKTKETIVRLQERVKTLRAKLSAQKKEIGKVSTKQSASKILKLEAQIEATNEKLKRAKKRLSSAQKRLEVATVDAELASDLLNQPALEIQQQASKSKKVVVAPKHEVRKAEPKEIEDDEDLVDDFESDDTDVGDTENTEDAEIEEDEEDVNADNDIKPLFDKDPEILNEDIAFKPITFDAPTLNVSQPEEPESVFNKEVISEDVPVIEQEAPKPMLDSMVPVQEEVAKPEVFEPRPVLESMTPVDNVVPVVEPKPEVPLDVPPVVAPESQYSRPVPPIMPVVNTTDVAVADKNTRSKPTFIYYLLLVILIILSIFTLWLYQKHAGTNGKPLLTAVVSEKVVEESVPETTKEVVVDKTETTKPEKVKGAEEFVFDDEDFDAEEDKTEIVDDREETEAIAEPEPTEDEVEVEETPEAEEDEVVEETAEPVVMDAVPANIMPTNDSDEEEVIEEETEEADVDKPEYDVGSKNDDMIVLEEEYQDSVDNPDEEDFYEE
jgi:hypothetical protein